MASHKVWVIFKAIQNFLQHEEDDKISARKLKKKQTKRQGRGAYISSENLSGWG